MIPPDFGAFWTQCQQQGFQPKAVTLGKCLLFPGAVASYPNPIGLSSEIWWSDRHPTTSSLTGQTSADLAAAYEAATGRQWTQPVGYVHSLFEVAIDALKRAGGASDKQALLDAMGATNLETIAGKVDFTNPVVPHVTKTPLVGRPMGGERGVGRRVQDRHQRAVARHPDRRPAGADHVLTDPADG